MLDVLIGGDKLAGNLIAPTNSPARSYSAFSPARLPAARQLAQPTLACSTVPPPPTAHLPPPVSAHRRAGLRSPPLRPHQLPLGGRATSPPFAVARPLPAPRCLASVCHPTASPAPRRPLVRANCCSPAALSDTELAPSLTPAQPSLRTPPSPAAATVRAAALLSNAHQQGLQHSRCSA